MERIIQYLITVTAASMICGILGSFFGKEGALAAACKLLSGLFLAFAVISPLVDIEWSGLLRYFSSITADADAVIAWGEDLAQKETAQIIKTRAEAYILDKASSLEADITVTVTLSTAEPYEPVSAELSGSISPYGKAQLSKYMEDELDIPKEAQVWTG